MFTAAVRMQQQEGCDHEKYWVATLSVALLESQTVAKSMHRRTKYFWSESVNLI